MIIGFKILKIHIMFKLLKLKNNPKPKLIHKIIIHYQKIIVYKKLYTLKPKSKVIYKILKSTKIIDYEKNNEKIKYIII